MVPGKQGKYIFTQESLYTEKLDACILDCKHKLMMKNGAPPDNNLEFCTI